jgi:hypothetical protein
MWSWLSRLLYPAYYRSRERSTVRYAFPIIALTALFAGLASVTSQNASYITITTNPSTVKEGEQVLIEVKAFAHTPVNAIDITLTYPENQFQVEGIDTGTSVITLWAEKPYAKNGKVYLRGGVFQRGFLGEHTVARVRARAIESGLAYVNVDSASFIAGDGAGTEVAVEKLSDTQTKIMVMNEEGALRSKVSFAIVTDLDGSGGVDLGDISAFMSAWFTRGKVYDFNADGRMTFRDFSILLSDSFFK